MKNNFVNIDSIYKQYVDRKFISLQDYKRICHLFIKFLIKKVFDGFKIELPFRLGYFFVMGSKTNPKIENGKIKKVAPDWAGTKKLWAEDEEAKKNKQLVYLLNEHTSGIRYRFMHSKKNSIVKHILLYRFQLTRHNKRALSKMIKEGKEFIINPKT